MPSVLNSTLLLTLLLAVGLFFFLRAASKDRTTVVEVYSPLPPLDVLNGIIKWLEQRGWKQGEVDPDRQVLRFQGNVASSRFLIVFLAILGALGSGSLGLVIRQVYPILGWGPLLLAFLGAPIAGYLYHLRAKRIEFLELRLLDSSDQQGSALRIRAHRDELIAMEIDLSNSLKLASDGALLSSPI